MTDFMPTRNTRTERDEFHQFFFDASARPKHAGEWRHIGDWDEEGKLVLLDPYATYGKRGECDAPSLKGRAAIVEAWNDLPEAVRQHNALAKLWHAVGQFEDAPEHPVGQLGPQALEGAYWQGWCEAADWAQRDDLHEDRDSQAYADAMNRRLGPIRAQAVHPVGSALMEALARLPRFRYGYADNGGDTRSLGYIPDPEGPIVRYADVMAAALLAATPSRAPAVVQDDPILDECECGYGCPPGCGCRHSGESAQPAVAPSDSKDAGKS